MDEIEQRARTMGWVPQDEFRDKARWVDAETFVKRGEEIVPILKANTKKLESDVARLGAENAKLAQLFRASQESISELQHFHEENLKDALARQKRDLANQLAEAREEGDVHREVEIQTQIASLGKDTAPARKPMVEEPPPPQAPSVDAETAAWQAANPWFGQDPHRTQKAIGVAHMLRADPANDHLQGAAFYQKVVEAMNEGSAPRFDKVGGGRPSGEGGGGGSRGGTGYDSLPPDAQQACQSQARKLVGEGKAFKDMASWQAYYAKVYYTAEEKHNR